MRMYRYRSQAYSRLVRELTLRLAGVAIIPFMLVCAPASAQPTELGGNLRQSFERYHFGYAVPKNQARAEQYLREAAQYGSEWAILLLAQEQERVAPGKALEAYLRLARNDNCVAQARLAHAYLSGVLVKKNLTQAYFWLLLSKVNDRKRKADVKMDGAGRISYEPLYKEPCFYATMSPTLIVLQVKVESKRILPAKLVQAAQDAASNWTKGTPEKLLPSPVITATTASPSEARSKIPPKVATITPPLVPDTSPNLAELGPAPGLPIQTAGWTSLSKEFRRPPLRNRQSAEELFAKARSSVWVVIATTSAAQSDASTLVSQGSAIAVTRSLLITNYHVVDGQRFVFIKQGERTFEATVVSADKASDRCVLSIKEEILIPVDGLRGFAELRVGEPVYTIGSPSGLESTLGQGIVSGLRTVRGQHLVQTTAQISPGSSGGGLFDDAGNLVGITSFMLKNSQGLNFAIAAEDYYR